MRGRYPKRLLFIFLALVIAAILVIEVQFPYPQNSEKTNPSNEPNASNTESHALDVLNEMLFHFSSRQNETWLSYNVSGYKDGFEGLVSNGTTNFKVAVFVYENPGECMGWFEDIEEDLNSSLTIVNSSEGESCVWRLFSGNESYYLECSKFWGRGVLLVVGGSNETAVERLTWWFPTQNCLRPGTKLVVQTSSPKEVNS